MKGVIVIGIATAAAIDVSCGVQRIKAPAPLTASNPGAAGAVSMSS